MAMTVTAHADSSFYPVVLKVWVVTGATEAGGAVVCTGFSDGGSTFSMTPAYSGSVIVEGLTDDSGTSTGITPNTNNSGDGTASWASGFYWWFGHWTGTVTAGTPITTLGGTGPTGWYTRAAYEVRGASPAIDGSSPAAVAAPDAASDAVTSSFTPPAGSVLVAIVQGVGTATQTPSVSDSSGLSLTWTPRGTAYSVSYCGTVAVFTATVTSTATSAQAAVAGASGQALNGTVGSVTPPLYAGSATGPLWSYTSYATGSAQGTYATWTDSGSGTSAMLELASFNIPSYVPVGSTLIDVKCTVRHGETPADTVASVTAQAYSGSSPVGSPLALTAADAVHEDTVTFTGLAYADLADLRVRLVVTRK